MKITPWGEDVDAAIPMPSMLELEKIQVACQIAELPVALNELTYKRWEDELINRIVHTFSAYVYGRNVKEEQYAEPTQIRMDVVEHVPVSWWDHLKVTIVERWPWTRLKWKSREVTAKVQERTTVRKSIWHVCPHLNIDNQGRHLRFMQYDGADGYMPIGLEEKARQAVEVYMRNRPFPVLPELDRAMHEIHRILNKDRR